MRTATLCLLALSLGCATAQAQERADALFNLVHLSAQAEREIANDTLTAVLAADREGPDPAALAEDVNRRMREALKLAQRYVAVKSRTDSYQTWPLYETGEKGEKARIVRWRVRQQLRLESGDFAAIAELIGKLQATLAVINMTLAVSSEARKRSEDALLTDAIAAFKQRAILVRDALQAKAYRIRDLQISGGGPQPRAYSAPQARAAAITQPAIEPGTSQVQVTVSGTIQLQ